MKIKEKGKSRRKTKRKASKIIEESSVKGKECKLYQRHKENK
jgi:hypothetical protein